MKPPRRRARGSVRVPIHGLEAGEMPLPDHVVEYVCNVLRMDVGDRFTLFDPGSRLEASAELIDLGGVAPGARVTNLAPAKLVAERPVTLIQGLAKGDKMDAIVRDATELGVTRVVPAITERTIVRPGADDRRVERWRRIAVEAARQCGRGDVPEIEPSMPFDKAIQCFVPPSMLIEGAALCMDPRAMRSFTGRILHLDAKDKIVLIVGPEGGLSDEEIALCERHSATRVSLGPFVLRTETVCAAALGAILALAGISALNSDDD